MLESIKLRNFQKHRSLNLVLEPLTTLIGRTGAGKSAIMRALRWNLMNQPKGTSFITHGQKTTIVTVTINGHVVKRIRGAKKNLYKLDGKSLSAFGNGVPEVVQEVTKVSDINFQMQHDQLFWVSLSPTELAKRINVILDLSSIDKVLQRISADCRKAKHRVDFETERFQTCKTHRRNTKWVPEAIESFEAGMILRKRLDARQQDIARLRSIVDSVESIEQKLSRIETGLQTARHGRKLADATAKNRRDTLYLRVLLERLKRLEEIPDELFSVWDSRPTRKEHHCDDIRRIIAGIEKQDRLLAVTDNQLNVAQKKLSEIRICPKCKRPLNT